MRALEISIEPFSPKTWKTGGTNEKIWGLNVTSEVALFEAYGDETANWLGKTARARDYSRYTPSASPSRTTASKFKPSGRRGAPFSQTGPPNAPEVAYHVSAEVYSVPLRARAQGEMT